GKGAGDPLEPEERSSAEVEGWILVELLHRGVDRDKFSKSLPYTIKNLITGDAEDYSPRACAAGLRQLLSWFCVASSVLSNDGNVVCLRQTLMLIEVPGAQIPRTGFSPGASQSGEP